MSRIMGKVTGPEQAVANADHENTMIEQNISGCTARVKNDIQRRDIS
jgi:hypothetical protein